MMNLLLIIGWGYNRYSIHNMQPRVDSNDYRSKDNVHKIDSLFNQIEKKIDAK